MIMMDLGFYIMNFECTNHRYPARVFIQHLKFIFQHFTFAHA